VHDIALMLFFHGQAASFKHGEHAPVLRQHLRHESGDALFAADGGEVVQQEAGEPLAVVVLLDGERHLRAAGRAGPVDDHVAPAADDGLILPPTNRHDQRDRALEIELGGGFELRFAKHFFVKKEAGVDRFGIEVFESRGQPLLVVRPDRTDLDLRPVSEGCHQGVVGCVYHFKPLVC